jgi:hypothetical protein
VQKPVHRIFGRTRATVLGAALLSGAVLPAVGLGADSASATSLIGCPTSAGVITCTFSYTGRATDWTVPAGITRLIVGADGGSGASAGSTTIIDADTGGGSGSKGGGTGGNGGEYQAALSGIPPGTVLSIFPGGAGNGTVGGLDAGSGGGSSTTDFNGNSGGGGGGASTVAVGGDQLVVAGGGGGAGAENVIPERKTQLTGGTRDRLGAENQAAVPSANGGNGGGSGGVNGADGTPSTAGTEGGGGSTTSATGGANGGADGCSSSATDGSQLQGGNSNSGKCEFVGGGGGSGYYGGGGSAAGAGAGGGSAFPARATNVDGILVTPDTGVHATHTGNGRVTISYRRVPTHIRPNIFFNYHQTFTVTGTLDSHRSPVAGQPVIVSTGRLYLCAAITNSHGVAACVLSYAKSLAIWQHAGRYTVRFPGSGGYLPSSANGQAIIYP